MTAEQGGRGATGRAGDLAARLAALPNAQPAARPARERTPRKRDAERPEAGSRGAPPPPPEQGKPAAFYSERLSITTTAAQVQALRAARLADGIQATARLRAMIALWQDDERFRARVDRLARDWK